MRPNEVPGFTRTLWLICAVGAALGYGLGCGTDSANDAAGGGQGGSNIGAQNADAADPGGTAGQGGGTTGDASAAGGAAGSPMAGGATGLGGGSMAGAAGVPGAGGAVGSAYPVGPYGFKVNDVVSNFTFTTVGGETISMEQLRARPGVKVILWSSGAEWCTICKVQAPKLSKLSEAKKSQGLLVFETLHQNTQGGSSDAATLQRWQQALKVSHELFVEKNPNYAGHSDNPLELIIDAKTMKIRFRQLHTSSDLDVQVQAALTAAGT